MTNNDTYTLYDRCFRIDGIEELNNIMLSRVDIFYIVDKFNHGYQHYTDFRDTKYFENLCDDAVNTINIELEHINKFDKQYIRYYISDITPAKQSIIMLAGGIDKIQLDTETLNKYKKLFVNHYNTTECFKAGLKPINASIADYFEVRSRNHIGHLFCIVTTVNIDNWNNIEYISNEIEHNRRILIKQRLLYEQIKALAHKVA